MTSCAQTKNGSRIQLRPLARSWTIVTMKLTEPRSDEVIRKTMPISHQRLAAELDDRQRRIRRPAGAARRRRGMKKLASMTTPPTKYTQ